MDVQTRFMYLFERIGEPLYFGPRGNSNVLYNVPVDNLPENRRKAMTTVRAGFNNMNLTPINMPGIQAPDLSNLGKMCPRNSLFSYFLPSHKTAADQLTNMFMSQSDSNNFLALASVCRDNENVNCALWVHAVASACLQRRDMRGFRLPPLYEILPDSFFNPHVMRQAQEQAIVPVEDRTGIMITMETTGGDNNPENVLNYFREDIALNSHHWHWHLIYKGDAPRAPAPGSRDRKGELFYYMHHSMMARYDAERLSNGMARTTPLAINRPVAEGYFPKLTQASSGSIWGSRQEGTMVSDVNRMMGDRSVAVTLELMRMWNDRIFEAIDSGIIVRNGVREALTEEKGIDVLGDIVENASTLTPSEDLYGNLHNMGHVMLAFAHDPLNRHNENNGVMGSTVGAMRDPVFYRWHKHIDDIFDRYKRTLPPYQDKLIWRGVQVTSISVQTGKQPVNNLITHWTMRDLDLARGLDFSRTSSQLGKIWARFTTMDHMPFTYRIQVTNASRQTVNGTVRIFMAPRNDERGARLPFAAQRLLFFELDKFVTQLQPGQNTITRNSTDSSVTIPWPQSFDDLENFRTTEEAQINGADAVCGCGYPQHMLIPRGSPGQGMLYDLFVIISNEAEDRVQRRNGQSANQRGGCKESISYCGLLDELYPDKKPMGYPFDRQAFVRGTRTPIRDLDAFIPANSNMRYQQVRITHRENLINVVGRAPSGMNFIDANGAAVAANGSNNRRTGGGSGQTGNRTTQTTQGGRGGRGQVQRPNSNSPGTQTPPRSPSPMTADRVPINFQAQATNRVPPGQFVSSGSSPPAVWAFPQSTWRQGRDSRSPSPDNFEHFG